MYGRPIRTTECKRMPFSNPLKWKKNRAAAAAVMKKIAGWKVQLLKDVVVNLSFAITVSSSYLSLLFTAIVRHYYYRHLPPLLWNSGSG